MSLKDAGARGSGGGRRPPGKIGDLRPVREIRMEWMDPLSWRLPSGKALAEFALQAGFLAPLMLVGPRFKKPKKPAGPAAASGKQMGEVPGSSGSFRETDIRETGIRETR